MGTSSGRNPTLGATFDVRDDPIWIGAPEERSWVFAGFGDETIDVGYGLFCQAETTRAWLSPDTPHVTPIRDQAQPEKDFPSPPHRPGAGATRPVLSAGRRPD